MTGNGKSLHVWMEGRHVGVFTQRDDSPVTFSYDDAATTPISLSLPLDGSWTRRAPGRFLDNLLPDSPSTRRAMASSVGASDDSAFSLLAGADSSGGLVFTADDEPPERHGRPVISIATPDDIATRVNAMTNAPDSWWQPNVHDRFSLAGNQPKFTLARRGANWYWPNSDLPSTHILKPTPSYAPDAPILESCSSYLAKLCGLDSTESGLMTIAETDVFITERFDRRWLSNGSVQRIHTEDMAQALGIATKDKYKVSARKILGLLEKADPTLGLSYSWIAQLAFNVSIGNVDAHAKNYSLILSNDGISLSPMYDLLTTTYWQWVDRSLPMRVGGATGAKAVSLRSWEKLALDNGLDPGTVIDIAGTISARVLEYAETAYSDAGHRISDHVLDCIRDANTAMDPGDPDMDIFPFAGDVPPLDNVLQRNLQSWPGIQDTGASGPSI